MSTYNEYLDHDFKLLGFHNYNKMLDTETPLKNFRFLSTTDQLNEPFGRYALHYSFAIEHPSQRSGKRPRIALIGTSLLDNQADNNALAVKNVLYYNNFPTRQQMKDHAVQFLEEQRHVLAIAEKFSLVTPHGPEGMIRQIKKVHKPKPRTINPGRGGYRPFKMKRA